MNETEQLRTIFGGAVKIIEGDLDSDELVVSGPGLVFSKDDDGDEPIRDLHGEYFTNRTFLGHNKGDGVMAMFNHGYPLLYHTMCGNGGAEYIVPKSLFTWFRNLSDHRFEHPVKTTLNEEEQHMAATLVLNMRNEYEEFVAKQAAKGLLGWSSGSAPHVVKMTNKGEITDWPIVEFSLTPTPAESRTAADAQFKSVKTFLKSASLPDEFDLDWDKILVDVPNREPNKGGARPTTVCQTLSISEELRIKQELYRIQDAFK
ncbi:MAG: hypothetical protein OXH34_01775 [Bacteroidetes bacterium]|nr:hypothetical protein [Bacteroidota bacterium]